MCKKVSISNFICVRKKRIHVAMMTVQTVKTLPFLLFVGQGEFLLYETAKLFICSINILKPRQNGRHFADDIFKCIFLNEYVWISIKIPLKSVPGGPPINIVPTLVMIMAWRRPGEKPLSEPMLVRLPTQWKSPFCSVESYVGSLDKVHGVVTIRNTPVICWSRVGVGRGGGARNRSKLVHWSYDWHLYVHIGIALIE